MADEPAYAVLKEKAAACALRIGMPSFYREYLKELEISAASLLENPLLRKCRSFINETALHPAHGMPHGERVAVEAGAILRVECSRDSRPDVDALMVCVQVAGLFHDIKRAEPDHTIRGSQEVELILRNFDLPAEHKRYITAAIRNHEAFREVLGSEDAQAQLVSDSLYDADKFRWGPDNFTTTLWLILEHRGTPMTELYGVFREKLQFIRRIRETFRSGTGRRYGPEFIDKGLEIGDEIYAEMSALMGVQ